MALSNLRVLPGRALGDREDLKATACTCPMAAEATYTQAGSLFPPCCSIVQDKQRRKIVLDTMSLSALLYKHLQSCCSLQQQGWSTLSTQGLGGHYRFLLYGQPDS